MKRTSALILAPVLAALLGAVGWGWVWYRPTRDELDRLRREVTSLRTQRATLAEELARAQRADLSVPAGRLSEAEQAWARIAELLGGMGFTLERLETTVGPATDLQGQPPAQPQPAPASGPPAGGAAVPPGQPGAPAGSAPPGPRGPAGGGAPLVSPPAVPLMQVRVSLRFAGDYLRLQEAVGRAGAAIPALGWTRLEMEGRGDGRVVVQADAVIVALPDGADARGGRL